MCPLETGERPGTLKSYFRKNHFTQYPPPGHRSGSGSEKGMAGNSVRRKTATLELKVGQAETLARRARPAAPRLCAVLVDAKTQQLRAVRNRAGRGPLSTVFVAKNARYCLHAAVQGGGGGG